MRAVFALSCLLLSGCELIGGIEVRAYTSAGSSTTAGGGGEAGSGGGSDCAGPVGDPTSCPSDCGFPCTVGPVCPRAVQLVGGGAHTCLLLDDGTVWCWGAQDKGQLGYGLQVLPSAPVRLCVPPAKAISAGSVHGCAVDQGGDVWCWGGNRFAEAGEYGEEYILEPTRVPGLSQVEAIETHGIANCARTSGGSVFCWGLELNGQGWNGQEQYAFYPEPQAISLTGVSVIGVRAYSACALVGSDLSCWGEGDGGQLGNGAFDNSAEPVLADWPSNATLQKIEAGSDHVCALSDNSAVWCWGFNNAGQCGLPTGTGDVCPGTGQADCYTTPRLLPFDPPGQVVDIAGGWRHMCARTDLGEVHCWGNNSSQEAGPGPAVVTPQLVLEGASVMGVGRHHSCAVVGTEVRCWGWNKFGQIDPQGSTEFFAMPLPISFSP